MVKLSGSPVSADRPRVKVAAVTTEAKSVNAPTVKRSGTSGSTRRPQNLAGLTPVIAET
ncbi:hypothetical protein LNQ52_29565 [Klebsiella pneumoniae subsp. pneumoniae]|nr:hypothetical protein [Klebsiella pneumoniae subsp. pneumoniae]